MFAVFWTYRNCRPVQTMLSNFCVVFTITWNVSVGLGSARPGAAAVEPQDASAAVSVNTRAAVSADVPRSLLVRRSPQGLQIGGAGDPWAWRVSIGSWNALWQRLSTSWIGQPTHALAISDHSTSTCSISSEISSRAAPKPGLTHASARPDSRKCSA